MFQVLKLSVVALMVAGFLGFASSEARAQDTGKVTVTVTGQDDNPVEGVDVVLVKPFGGKKKAPAAEQAAGGKQRPAPIAEGKTVADGTVTLEAPVGEYAIMARKGGEGARATVTIAADTTETVALKLAPMGGKGGKKGGKKEPAAE